MDRINFICFPHIMRKIPYAWIFSNLAVIWQKPDRNSLFLCFGGTPRYLNHHSRRLMIVSYFWSRKVSAKVQTSKEYIRLFYFKFSSKNCFIFWPYLSGYLSIASTWYAFGINQKFASILFLLIKFSTAMSAAAACESPTYSDG